MASLAEKLAAKKAAAAQQDVQPLPSAPKHGLRLTGKPAEEPIGVMGMTGAHDRQLGYPDNGEHIPMKHAADGADPQWSRLAHSFKTELCVVVAEGHQDECWLAVWANHDQRPLLIHKLICLPLRYTKEALIPF